VEDGVLKLPMMITMSCYLYPGDPWTILPRRSAEDRKVSGRRVKEQVEALHNSWIDVGRVSVFGGFDKQSFKVSRYINEDWHMIVRCGQR